MTGNVHLLLAAGASDVKAKDLATAASCINGSINARSRILYVCQPNVGTVVEYCLLTVWPVRGSFLLGDLALASPMSIRLMNHLVKVRVIVDALSHRPLSINTRAPVPCQTSSGTVPYRYVVEDFNATFKAFAEHKTGWHDIRQQLRCWDLFLLL
jgi:hypothetical protein